ncbi:MAG TPA: acetate/propionate family kinase [Acidimicrobiales bacterium]|nr:acetate/propionate family kinase [Acidimicrobiales bacterium]
MRVLVVNAGSSSLKLDVLEDDDEVVASARVAPVGRLRPGELEGAVAGLGPIDAVGHRVVHGGTELTEPVLVDAGVRARLQELVDLAPLHQPASLKALDEVGRLTPGVPVVACFDTAFHATLPPEASTYAIPAEWRERFSARRFGFHGLSHAYAARRAAELAGPPGGDLRVVTCHLGAGASLSAVQGGRSRDTTMGFTPLEGLVMATRSGTVDPGLLLWLQTHGGLGAGEVADALEHRSGLLALAGTDDTAAVVAEAIQGSDGPRLALAVYLHRLRAAIAAMVAAVGGLDALVFTGGVGENAPAVREGAAHGLRFLGVVLDRDGNAAAGPDRDVTGAGSTVRVLVIRAREDIEIARGVRAVLRRS